MKGVGEWLATHSRVPLRVWQEARLPLLVGLFWGLLAWVSGRTYFESASAGGAAFFFSLFAQGQVLRIAKNVRDERNVDEWRGSFQSIKQGLEELRNQRLEEARSYDQPPKDSNDWLLEARRAVSAGAYLQSAILAARAFEEAADHCISYVLGRHFSYSDGLLELVKRNPKYADELKVLTRLTNGLRHGQYPDGELNEAQANELIKNFKRGIDLMYKLIDNDGV